MTKLFEDYDDIINCTSIPEDFREMFEATIGYDALDDYDYIVVTLEWLDVFNSAQEVRNVIENHDGDVMVICVSDYGGTIIFGNSDDVIAEL